MARLGRSRPARDYILVRPVNAPGPPVSVALPVAQTTQAAGTFTTASTVALSAASLTATARTFTVAIAANVNLLAASATQTGHTLTTASSIAQQAASSTITARVLTPVVNFSLAHAAETTTALPLKIPSTVALQAASSTATAHSFTLSRTVSLLAAGVNVAGHTPTLPRTTALSLASNTITAFSPGVLIAAGSNLLTAHDTVTAFTLTPSFGGGVTLLAAGSTETGRTLTPAVRPTLSLASSTATAHLPAVGVSGGANLLAGSQIATAHTLAPVFAGGTTLQAAGSAQTARLLGIPASATLSAASSTVTAHPFAMLVNVGLVAAGQTVTTNQWQIARTVSLLAAGSTTTPHAVATLSRSNLSIAGNTITAWSPTVVVPPATIVHLQTAIAATITAHPIGSTPPTFVNLLVANARQGANRIGPPNLPVMTMTYASGYDNYGNYIPKGFNLYGTQNDQMSMSQDVYFIPQPVHGVTTNVFLPTVSFTASTQYTTKTYNPSIIFSTPNNIGQTFENTYTTINSGSIDQSGGSAGNTSGINLSGEPYDGSFSSYVSFQAGSAENVAIFSDGLHVVSGNRIALTSYQQSPNTSIQPGLLAELNNQGTSNEFTSTFLSGGETSTAGETYLYLQSPNHSGSSGNLIEFVMNGSVEAELVPGTFTVFGNIAANNYSGGQSITGFPLAGGTVIGTVSGTNVSISTGFLNALNSIAAALRASGVAV